MKELSEANKSVITVHRHPPLPPEWERSVATQIGNAFEAAIARLAQERSRSENAIQVLKVKLICAQEEERRRIARDLHDDLNQELNSLAGDLEMLIRRVPKEETELIEFILNLRGRAEYLSNNLHTMTHQLHPAALEHLGLVSALRSHFAEFSRRTNILVSFTVEQKLTPSPNLSICLYRVIQEALRNVARHSHATEVFVTIKKDPDGILLSIVDNGCGFQFDDVWPNQGLGLTNIRERVEAVKGQLVMSSAPGEGVRIEISAPVRWKEHKREHKRKQAVVPIGAD
jgi:signal transduction histidine kinase